jgi:4-carboxymuconolactone decarboxylase
MKKIVAFKAALILASLALSQPGRAEDRFPALTESEMTPQQKSAVAAIMAGPRKALGGPFNTWLRSPELAQRLQKVGEYFRLNSDLPPALTEFATLISARALNSKYQWHVHYPFAISLGVDPKILSELAAGGRPKSMSTELSIIYDFATELRTGQAVSDKTFTRAKAVLGEKAVVDLITLCGFSDLVAITMSTAQVEVQAEGPRLLPPRTMPQRAK